ncbi:hypothetical protein BBBOND_0107490 [Babesia bigemina]|uniref:Uncharacterized protein n=1 Tax=Babesia bigemina TaxID=5866 RepID=A0A061D0W7_BABBI|nr:hypothetical protein BBBOND_0107490 [Babesia bigemina]CDR94451.1 hypothetical protein BBBOND_0107490 [Babesia bigemina]|eukprot:XP_012766637.1 hypothetical protein BBBOND_0107490 [Babesia bigemina]
MIPYDAALGDKGGKDDPDGSANAPQKIAFYLNNSEFNKHLQNYLTVTSDCEAMAKDLRLIVEATPDPQKLSNVEAALKKEGTRLWAIFENLIQNKIDYVELRHTLDDYIVISKGLQAKNVTPQKMAELNKQLADLEERFVDIERIAHALVHTDVAAEYKDTIIYVKEFIQKHMPKKLSTPSNVINKPKPKDNTSATDQKNNMASMGKGDTPCGKCESPKPEKNTDNTNVTHGTTGASGFVMIGAKVVRNMAILGVIAVV